MRRIGWENESDDLEEIGELARTAGNLKVRISKAPKEEVEKREGPGKREDPGKSEDLGKRGGLEKREGGLFPDVKNFDLRASSLKSALRNSLI